jgi:uncharacterized protein YraI
MSKLARILIIVLVMLGIGVMGAGAQDDETGAFRFVHAIPGVSSIDIYTDGNLSVRNLNYGQASNYLNVPAGARQITVRPAGLTTNLWQQSVNAIPDRPKTLVAFRLDPLEFTSFEDDFSPLPLGDTRFQAVYAIGNGPSVDIVTNDMTIASGLEPGNFIGIFDIASDAYMVTAFPSGGPEENALLRPTLYGLVSNTSHMLLLYGTASIPSALLLTAPTAPDDDSAALRLAHGVAGAPAVDVYLDDVLVAPALDFGDVTGHFMIPASDYQLELRASGENTVLLERTLAVDADSAVTAIAQGSVDDLFVSVYQDDVAAINEATAVISVINTIPGSTVSVTLEDGTLLADELTAGEAGVATSLEPTSQAVILTLTVDGQSVDLAQDATDFYGGVYYNIIAVEGSAFSPPTLVFAPTTLAQGIASAPGADRMVIVEAPAVEEEPEIEIVEEVDDPDVEFDVSTEAVEADEPTPEPPIVEQPAIVATPAPVFPTARIVLDPGANLHLRQYPSSQALSLGLAPSGTVLIVNGREGAPIDPEGNELPVLDEQGEETEWVDPAELLEDDEDRSDLEPSTTWLNIVYETPDGGQIVAWVNSQYLDVRDTRGRPQVLAELPTVPGNRPGQAFDTAITPPPLPENRVTVRITGLDSGTNLNVRRTPVRTGEVLWTLPNGSAADFVALSETGEWVFIRYEPSEGGVVTGWVSTRFVLYEFRNRSIDLEEMEERGLLEIAPEGEFCDGSILCGQIRADVQPAIAQPTRDPMRDAFVAEVRINPDANLNLRRTPNAQAEVIERIGSGERLIVEGRTEDGEWLLTSYNNQVGWIASAFVVLTYNDRIVELEDVPVVELDAPLEESDDETEDEG